MQNISSCSKFALNKACAELNKILFIFFFCLLFLLPSSSQAQLIEPNSEALESTGDVILVALPATAALTTLILEDRQGSWQFTKGFLVNAGVTLALKYGVNKRRPFNSGGQAFPSGHTSITMQAASFIHLRYGWEYGIPAYMLAGLTAYSRINATRHDGWDVLAGTVAGIGSSFLFTTPYQREHMALTFTSSEEEFMVGFIYKF